MEHCKPPKNPAPRYKHTMKNADLWNPTKFTSHRGRLRGSRDKAELNPVSRLIADRVAAFYSEAINEYCKGDLVDLGCGKAPFYDAYKGKSNSVLCVDWPSSLHDIQHADVEADLNLPLELEDEIADTIICSDVLEHLHTPSVAVSEMRRILRPGGVVLLNTPFYHPLHEQPFDYHRFTAFALKRMFEEAGFSVTKLIEVGAGVDVVVDLVTKTFSRVRGCRFLSGQMQTAYSSLSRRKSLLDPPDHFSAFPLGYGVVAHVPS